MVIVGIVAVIGVLAGSAPAQAAGSTASHVAGVAPPSRCCSFVSTIKGTGERVEFDRKTVTGSWKPQPCSQYFFSFAIGNDTRQSQGLVYLGSPLGVPIAPNHTRYLCFDNVASGVIGLANDPKAQLDFTIT
jgi:hypothetical protein